MKINEVITEGVVGGALKNVAGGLLKGVAQGIGGVVAPQSTEYISKTKLAKPLPKAGAAGEQPAGQQPTVNPVNIPGFTVIQQDPIIINYRKNDYALNNEGEWYRMGAKGTRAPAIKDIDPALDMALDRVAGFPPK